MLRKTADRLGRLASRFKGVLADLLKQRSADKPLITREAQLGVMAGVTLVLLAVVSSLLRFCFTPSHPNPFTFWLIELAVITASIGVGFGERIWQAVQIVLFSENPDDQINIEKWGQSQEKWERRRKRFGGYAVVAAVAANMFALEQVVSKTGEGIHSPFAPLLTGPALFGAFVAQSRLGMAPLLGISAGVILWLDLEAPRHHTTHADLALIGTKICRCANANPVPDRASYAIPAMSLLLVAGFISTFRIRRATSVGRE
jgi:hypothetical protein